VAVVKWIFVALFGIASVGALGMAFTSGGVTRKPSPRTAPPIALREFPPVGALANARAAPEPVAEKTPEAEAAKPEPVAAKTPEPVAKSPVAAAKAPDPVAAKPPEPIVPKAPVAEGIINLRASDTADVYLDGKKLGGSPLLGLKAKVGNHKVRFDCYDAAGNTVAGPLQTIVVKTEAEVDIEYPCPVE
jgi:hypothetical protein